MTNKKCEGIDCAWCMSIECPTKESKMTDKEQVTNSKEQTNGSLKNQDKNFNENFTQEKEQIIIDGIQFNKFGDFYVDYDLNGKFQSISSSAKEYKILKSLIKQLARKTQECKQLKEDYAELEQECERLKSYGATLLADKNAMEIGRDDYMQRCKRLEQECEELKEEQNEIKKFLGISHKPIMQRLEELHERSDKYKDRILELEQECEELKKRATIAEDNFACEVQARLYHQNEWLKFSKECEELKKELNGSEKWRIKAESLNEKLELNNGRYRKALEEIERELKEDIYCESQECGCDDYEECLRCTKNIILDIINNAKGE